MSKNMSVEFCDKINVVVKGDVCQDNGKCAFVNRKAQGSNAFYEECSGKYLVSVIEHNSIYMFCVREDASLAWLGK